MTDFDCSKGEHWWWTVTGPRPRDARQQLAETGQITIEIGPIARCVFCGELMYPPGYDETVKRDADRD